MRGGASFAFHQCREREHDGNAGHEYEHWKNEIVEAKSFPIDVLQLRADEASGRSKRASLVSSHFLQRPRPSVAAENPENREAPQRIQRGDSTCGWCRRRNGELERGRTGLPAS